MTTSSRVTFTSELLAALSIIASGTTYLYQSLWKEQQIELNARVANSTPKMLSILATNTGGRDVVVTSARIRSEALGDNFSIKLKIKLEGELVKKGESVLLAPSADDFSAVVRKDNETYKGTISETVCMADINFVGPDGEIRLTTTKFTCYAANIIDWGSRLP